METTIVLGSTAAIIVFTMLIILLQTIIKVCAPNKVLVITGATTNVGGKEYGFRIQSGGWTYVIPYFQQVQSLDLGIIPINVRIEGVNSANGITVGADGNACVCIDHRDPALLYAAVERLLGKSRPEIQEQLQQTMVGNFRGALNRTTPLQAIGMQESVDHSSSESMITVKKNLPARINNQQLQNLEEDSERANFRRELLQDSNQDLSTFGMRVVSVSLQNIWDTSNYIGNLASKTLAAKRQEVEVQEARLRARAEQAESDGKRREIVSVNQANEKILASQQELEILRRQCQAAIEQASLEANSAVAKAKNEAELAINQMSNELQKLRNVSEVTLQPDAERQATEIRAAGESESVRLLQELQNDLLIQKVQLLTHGGEAGKVALFMSQNVEKIFQAYQQHAQNLTVDNFVMMDETRGFNGVVNRGPQAMVDFLAQFEQAFGISVRELMTVNNPKPSNL